MVFSFEAIYLRESPTKRGGKACDDCIEEDLDGVDEEEPLVGRHRIIIDVVGCGP